MRRLASMRITCAARASGPAVEQTLWSSWLFCVPPRRAGHLVPDAHLAALAIEHGCAIYSTDTTSGALPASNT
jgi:predicted nucleic acid-binding protein